MFVNEKSHLKLAAGSGSDNSNRSDNGNRSDSGSGIDQTSSTAKKSLIVVIKPTSGATYKNFVDIMDDLNIAKITTAPSIDDDHITAAEIAFMKEKKIL